MMEDLMRIRNLLDAAIVSDADSLSNVLEALEIVDALVAVQTELGAVN